AAPFCASRVESRSRSSAVAARTEITATSSSTVSSAAPRSFDLPAPNERNETCLTSIPASTLGGCAIAGADQEQLSEQRAVGAGDGHLNRVGQRPIDRAVPA